jgi:lipopolysaccharide/colanic/teichoic acid biosynthesis glycosyltransferase
VYRKIFKHFFDIIISVILFIIFSPILGLIAFLLLLMGFKNPLFIQNRTGLKGRTFRLYKFKTMNDRRDASGNLLPDADRMTRFGRFLRSTSLDELPQLINVIKGDMSLVGPRPLLPKYLPLYNERQARRHEVKPGITGWSQVNCKKDTTWEEKLEMDIVYIDNLSFIFDLKIILLTLIYVFKRMNEKYYYDSEFNPNI